jgi:hypothetical protein
LCLLEEHGELFELAARETVEVELPDRRVVNGLSAA